MRPTNDNSSSGCIILLVALVLMVDLDFDSVGADVVAVEVVELDPVEDIGGAEYEGNVGFV